MAKELTNDEFALLRAAERGRLKGRFYERTAEAKQFPHFEAKPKKNAYPADKDFWEQNSSTANYHTLIMSIDWSREFLIENGFFTDELEEETSEDVSNYVPSWLFINYIIRPADTSVAESGLMTNSYWSWLLYSGQRNEDCIGVRVINQMSAYKIVKDYWAQLENLYVRAYNSPRHPSVTVMRRRMNVMAHLYETIGCEYYSSYEDFQEGFKRADWVPYLRTYRFPIAGGIFLPMRIPEKDGLYNNSNYPIIRITSSSAGSVRSLITGSEAYDRRSLVSMFYDSTGLANQAEFVVYWDLIREAVGRVFKDETRKIRPLQHPQSNDVDGEAFMGSAEPSTDGPHINWNPIAEQINAITQQVITTNWNPPWATGTATVASANEFDLFDDGGDFE